MTATMGVLAALVLGLSAGPAWSRDEALPAERLIAAIQAAVAATPGGHQRLTV